MDVPNPFRPTPIPADVQNRLFQIMTGQPNAQLPPLNASPPTGNLAQLLLPPGTQFQTPAIPAISTARVPDVHNTAPLSQMLLPGVQPPPVQRPTGVAWDQDLTRSSFASYLALVMGYIGARGQVTGAPYGPLERAVYDAIVNRSNASNTPYGRMMRHFLDLYTEQAPTESWSISTNERLILERFKRYLQGTANTQTVPTTPQTNDWTQNIPRSLFAIYLSRVVGHIVDGRVLVAPVDAPEEAIYKAVIDQANATNTPYDQMLDRFLNLYIQQSPVDAVSISNNRQRIQDRFRRYLQPGFGMQNQGMATQQTMGWTPEININNFGYYVQMVLGYIRSNQPQSPVNQAERDIYEAVINHADSINIAPNDDLIRFIQLYNRTAVNLISPLEMMTYLQRLRTYIMERPNQFPIANNQPTFANMRNLPTNPFGEVNPNLQPTAAPAFSAVQPRTETQRKTTSHAFANLPPTSGVMQFPTLGPGPGAQFALSNQLLTLFGQVTTGTRLPTTVIHLFGLPTYSASQPQVPIVTPFYNVSIVHPLPVVVNVQQPIKLISERASESSRIGRVNFRLLSNLSNRRESRIRLRRSPRCFLEQLFLDQPLIRFWLNSGQTRPVTFLSWEKISDL